MPVEPTDYVDVATAKFDLRLDGDASDAALGRMIPEAVDLAGRLTGRDLLAVADVDAIPDGLKALVSAVLAVRYDGTHEMPPAVYAMAAPYRVLVTPAADD